MRDIKLRLHQALILHPLIHHQLSIRLYFPYQLKSLVQCQNQQLNISFRLLGIFAIIYHKREFEFSIKEETNFREIVP